MPKSTKRLMQHPEFRILTLLIGVAVFSWPLFSGRSMSIGLVYGSLFFIWLMTVFALFLHDRSGAD